MCRANFAFLSKAPRRVLTPCGLVSACNRAKGFIRAWPLWLVPLFDQWIENMRIIDRYLLRQFLQVFFICFVSFDGLYIVIDAFSNLDEFLHYAESEGTVGGIIIEFYLYRSLFLFERMSSMLTMITGMFTVTWIQRYNELTALTAAGVSRA